MPTALTLQELLAHLKEPPSAYSPWPFWFLNGDLTHSEIRRQMKDFYDHGVYGAVLHPRMGLSKRIGYLSPKYFRYLKTAVETAAELGMSIVLYDEGMYPSGSAGGMIVKNNPDLASRGIVWTAEPTPGDHVLLRTEHGCLAERFSGGNIRGVHFGEDDGEKNAPPSADILNPEAVQAFIRLTHEAHYRELKPYFGSTIRAFFTDEPSILGRNAPQGMMPWTKDFDRIFCRAGGHLEGLEGLFTGKENEDTALYRRLILERECEVYYAPLSRWCGDHGIALMGHPHQSDDIEGQRYFQIPGQDLVFRFVAPEKGDTVGMDSVMAKCSADMARLMGRERNANECFGACNREGNPWYFTGADMKWYLDYLAVRGVNLFVPHAFYYILKGQRSQERPPDVGPGSIWWPHWRQWAEYMRRLACLRTETEEEIHLALLCRNRDMHPEKAAPLFKSQRAFQYIPESFYPACRVEGNELVLGERRYQAVLGGEEIFPGVPHETGAVEPVLKCDPPEENLRAVCLRTGNGDKAFMLVNASQQETPDTCVTVPCERELGKMDLWTGKTAKIRSEKTGEGRRFRLKMAPCESCLIFACDGEMWQSLPEKAMPERVLTNIDFTLTGADGERFTKTYTASVPGDGRDTQVTIRAEEMAELYAGDRLIGAAFWAPQRFFIPGEMLTGEGKTLRLVITGSPANRYGRPVNYGLITD